MIARSRAVDRMHDALPGRLPAGKVTPYREPQAGLHLSRVLLAASIAGKILAQHRL